MNWVHEIKCHLTSQILPYWLNKLQDKEHGGFYGRIDGAETIHKEAHKGAILNARILWTFSAAFRLFQKSEYLVAAARAYEYLIDHFMDKKHGGIFWEVDHLGRPVHTKKQIYAQGFALYGFSEFYRASSIPEALDEAKKLFYLIEEYGKDPQTGGYWEAFDAKWQPISDVRLSPKDANEKKSMNTHLHILEPYTNLMRVWRTPQIEEAQKSLINLFADKIVHKETNHLHLFFDENWQCKSTTISYGHDIEASWLLVEAAEMLGDQILLQNTKKRSLEMVKAAMEGWQLDGSMIYEKEGAHTNAHRHWWVQAETVVGLIYAWKHSGEKQYLEKAKSCWNYIQRYIWDKEHGEWFWSVDPHGAPNRKDDKAGFWKCPYHNGRLCMEIYEHFNRSNDE